MRLLGLFLCVAAAGCAATPEDANAPQAPETRSVRTGSRLPSNDAGYVQGTSGDAWQNDRRGGGVSRGDRMN